MPNRLNEIFDEAFKNHEPKDPFNEKDWQMPEYEKSQDQLLAETEKIAEESEATDKK